jgi:hypothetical protein
MKLRWDRGERANAYPQNSALGAIAEQFVDASAGSWLIKANSYRGIYLESDVEDNIHSSQWQR